ncbi:MAG: SGNH/GDSL hydrolase family protein [Opitutaceae bacterium]
MRYIPRFFLILILALAGSLGAAPEKWKASIDKFTAADAANPPPQGAILFAGSSSIVKWTTLKTDFPGKTILNRGFGGSELSDLLHYADRIVIPYAPSRLVIYGGENDLQQGQTAAAVHATFRGLCEKVHAALPKTRIAFISLKPSPSRVKILPAVIEANRLIAAECARDPRRVFIDIYPAMLGADGQPRRELFVADMLHLNADGYAVWRPLVAPFFE